MSFLPKLFKFPQVGFLGIAVVAGIAGAYFAAAGDEGFSHLIGALTGLTLAMWVIVSHTQHHRSQQRSEALDQIPDHQHDWEYIGLASGNGELGPYYRKIWECSRDGCEAWAYQEFDTDKVVVADADRLPGPAYRGGDSA